MAAGGAPISRGELDPEAVSGLFDMLGADHEALAEIVDAFLEEGPERVAEVSEGLVSGDAALIGRAAHTLKSNAATFGAGKLESASRALEESARAGNLTNAPALVDEITAAWALVKPELLALKDAVP